VGYGIFSNVATVKDLDNCLKNTYWQLVTLGGVIRTMPGSIRQLDRGFYGIGLPQPSIECLVAQVQSLLVHYSCNTSLGHQLSTSINGMIIKMGVSDQPFQESYAKYSSQVTDCWAKRLWEKLDQYGITVILNDCPIKLPT
jgi:hypothetical protein